MYRICVSYIVSVYGVSLVYVYDMCSHYSVTYGMCSVYSVCVYRIINL